MVGNAPRATQSHANEPHGGLRLARRTYRPGWFYCAALAYLGFRAWLYMQAPQGSGTWIWGGAHAVAGALLLLSYEYARVDEAGIHVRSIRKWFTLRWDEVGGFGGKTSGDMDNEGRYVFRLHVRGTHGYVMYKVSPWITHQQEIRRLGRAYLQEAEQPYRHIG